MNTAEIVLGHRTHGTGMKADAAGELELSMEAQHHPPRGEGISKKTGRRQGEKMGNSPPGVGTGEEELG